MTEAEIQGKRCSLERMQDKISTFSRFGDTGHGGVTRLSLSAPALEARREFVRRMEGIGASVVSDDFANLYATLPGTEADSAGLPAILSGSHLDSVRQGGNYDGVLGVMGAMEVLETVALEKIPHRHPLTAVVWTNEEGARFPPAMMSSGVLCGKFDEAAMLAVEAQDIPGYTFEQALNESGFRGSRENRLDPARHAGLIELHIEQGPVLEAEGKEIGVVEGVVGMVNYEMSFYGQSDHAGTTPMPYRQDAFLAAAEGLQYLHAGLDALGDADLVYTTGEVSCHPNVHTVIPDLVQFSLDIRHRSPELLAQSVAVIEGIPAELARCRTGWRCAWERDPVAFDTRLVDAVQQSAAELGYSFRRMYSGAGHDAQYVRDVIPTTMIFVPSRDGHSHCELEYTSAEACLKGVNVLLQALLKADTLLP